MAALAIACPLLLLSLYEAAWTAKGLKAGFVAWAARRSQKERQVSDSPASSPEAGQR